MESSNLNSLTQIYAEFLGKKGCEVHFKNSVNIHSKIFASKVLAVSIEEAWLIAYENIKLFFLFKIHIAQFTNNKSYRYRNTEEVVLRCSVKKMFLKISQNSQEKTCTWVSFFNKLQTSKIKRSAVWKVSKYGPEKTPYLDTSRSGLIYTIALTLTFKFLMEEGLLFAKEK